MLDHTAPTTTGATSSQGKPLRIALAHDWLVIARGGEQVLEAIAQTISSRGHKLTSVYTMADNGASIGATIDTLPRVVSGVGKLPEANGDLRRWLFPLYPLAVSQLSRQLARDHAQEPIDLLISTSSAAIKGLRAPSGVPHVCYCHSPARYAWSQRGDYSQGSLLRRIGLGLYAPHFQRWDRRTASNVTHFFANSTHIATRIADCYSRHSQVLHPPVRTDYFTPDSSVQRDAFVLVVCALEPYKRVDAAIEAAHAAKRQLVVVGTGSDMPRLRELAKRKNVIFSGKINDASLRDHYRRAHALLYPQVEDFGITAVEAQACGTPVIALGRGGALDTVIDHQTGLLLPDHAAFPGAMRRCPHKPHACRANAVRFSTERFKQRFVNLMQGLGLGI